ncbi:signal recognition particle-docking protein FtsY [Beggiatoa leptomitoformis]|uniref:Signal recognition particle receptor FtsY n=1 Tax=Beggiatoa leptomitoformis TaxID=288004 RepID=A0A2N9YH09_9GAMM|nr:signal recognition particle-docking protein FtsY [Beggiatoa leptomitoformis]ALG67940.1 signal recognition particle-docking protein FtsY [Beggiatoa leptomitoformis]AUI69787.1 signal recognition particle-docking protein FtsY [Beggiatoa leptomitoformis]
MFIFGKKQENSSVTPATEISPEQTAKPSLLNRLKQGLSRTRENLTSGLAHLLLGKKAIDATLLDELETLLLSADMGVDATQAMIKDLTERASRQQLKDSDALFTALQADMLSLLQTAEKPLVLPEKSNKPFVLLMVGVNGAGKTTTIGKLAKRFQAEGRSVMLAAGDTFRAAAVEQLQVWGERNQVSVIAQQGRADSASVIFDALQSATAKGIDVLIADTAGRLHTQSNLMAELQKVKRVLQKLDDSAPHEIMLVLDASIGQNALVQAQQFHQAVGVTGITLTKLDGTAKGGMIFAVAKKLNLPIRFIGVGEQSDDLRVFSAENFVTALLSREE